jgi:signal transduction histidine kinase
MLALLVGAIVVAAIALIALPLPVGGAARVSAIAAIVTLDVMVCATVGWIALSKNLTPVDEKLGRAERELADAERLASVGRIAAGIAHEVGNPLTGIANFAHVLRSRAAASPEADAALDGLEREVERVDRIVRGLLDYARPKAAATVPFDAAATLRGAIQLLSEQGVLRKVAVQDAIAGEPLELVGNAHQLEQVFVNILMNAIDAMNAQGTIALYAGRAAAGELLLAPRRAADADVDAYERDLNPRVSEWREQLENDVQCAKIVIADSGTGVSARDADRIFDPFYSTKPPAEGTGLGLSIVQRVVDAHRGVVWVQPAREGGAAFHVLIPLDFSALKPEDIS